MWQCFSFRVCVSVSVCFSVSLLLSLSASSDGPVNILFSVSVSPFVACTLVPLCNAGV